MDLPGHYRFGFAHLNVAIRKASTLHNGITAIRSFCSTNASYTSSSLTTCAHNTRKLSDSPRSSCVSGFDCSLKLSPLQDHSSKREIERAVERSLLEAMNAPSLQE